MISIDLQKIKLKFIFDKLIHHSMHFRKIYKLCKRFPIPWIHDVYGKLSINFITSTLSQPLPPMNVIFHCSRVKCLYLITFHFLRCRLFLCVHIFLCVYSFIFHEKVSYVTKRNICARVYINIY